MPRVKTKKSTTELPPETETPSFTLQELVDGKSVQVGFAARNTRRHRRLTVEQLAEAAGVSPDFVRSFEDGTALHAFLEKLIRIASAMNARWDVRFDWGFGSPTLDSGDAERFLPIAIAAAKAKGVPKHDYSWLVRLLDFKWQPLSLCKVREFCAAWEFEFDIGKYEAEEEEYYRRCPWKAPEHAAVDVAKS